MKVWILDIYMSYASLNLVLIFWSKEKKQGSVITFDSTF